MSQSFHSLSADEARELVCLVPLLRDPAVPAAHFTRLEELVCRREDGAWTYLKAMNVVAGLQWCFAPHGALVPDAGLAVSKDLATSHRELNERAPERSVRRTALGGPFSSGSSTQRAWRTVSDFFGRTAVGSVAVVALCFYGTFAILAWNLTAEPSHDFSATNERPTASVAPTVAKLTAAHDCVWESSATNQALDVNAAIRSGERLALRSGIAEIQFTRGAKILVEGPSWFDLQSTNGMRLQAGKLTARVSPRAVGFTVDTPQAKIVDLGTEFGLKVARDGTAEVHVLQGVIAAEIGGNGSRPTRTLTVMKGEGVRIPSNGISPHDQVERITANGNQFVRKLPASAKSQKPEVQIEAGDGTAKFRFPTLPSPSNNDAADAALGRAQIRALGPLQTGGNNLPAIKLLDGVGAGGGHVRFEAGKQGMFLMDLGRCLTVSQIVSFSWHVDGSPVGAPQAFDLFGSAAEAEPAVDGYLPSRGWRHLASVNTEQKLGSPPNCPSQQAVSVSGRNGPLGEFRYLLWVVTPLRGGPTYFDELDVYEFKP